MKTSIKLIQIFSDSNILRHYAVYLKLKAIHSNSVIYNYNISILSQKSGLSRNSIRKYIKFYLDNNWCTLNNNHLSFISLDKLRLKYGIALQQLIKIPSNGNITTLLNNLRYELLKLKNRQFNFLKNKATDKIDPKGKGACQRYKSAKKFFDNNNYDPTDITREMFLKISLKKLGCIINLSATSTHNIIKQKVLESKAVILRHSTECIKITTKAELKPNQYNYKGYIFTPQCNKYIFN